MTYAAHSLAVELRKLLSMEVADKMTLEAWYQEARRVHERLSESAQSIPHFHLVMHYLIDADTRLKDPRYRELQEGKIREIIEELERMGPTS